MTPPYTAYTNNAAVANLDSWPPTDGRTVTDMPTYVANNAVFNVKDYGAAGDGSTPDASAIQAAIDAAAALSTPTVFGATVYFPPGTYAVSTPLTVSEGVVLRGAGSRASRITSSYAGFVFEIGTTSVNLAYGCGVQDMSLQMTHANGSAIHAFGTAQFFMTNVYIEGASSGNAVGLYVDGSNASNLFTTLTNVNCNHVKTGLHIGTSGSTIPTSVTATAFDVSTDMQSGAVGILVDVNTGSGSQFFGGNIENCPIGVSSTGDACRFIGVRFEGNTNDVTLNSGAHANVFMGCFGWSTTTDNSGNDTNGFYGNRAGDFSSYPLDTISRLASGIAFGSTTARITSPAELTIANNASATITLNGANQFLIYDQGVTADLADLLVNPYASGTQLKLNQLNATYTTTPGHAGTINFSIVSGPLLSIENKLGSTTRIHMIQTQLG